MSTQISDLDKRQGELELSRKRKRPEGDQDSQVDKRKKHTLSDSDNEELSEGECNGDSDDGLSTQIDMLLGSDSSANGECSQKDQSDQWLEQFNADFVDEDIRSPPVSTSLAHLINGILNKKTDDKIKEKMGRFPCATKY